MKIMKKSLHNKLIGITISFVLVLACGLVREAIAQATFFDVTANAGIDHQFKVYEGSFGGGVCVLDFDNDGWEDIFLAGGMNDDQLLRNNHDGTFSNIYKGSGLEASAAFVTQGAASADVNKDGFVDIVITTINSKVDKNEIPRAPNLLFLNDGNLTFHDATEEFGLSEMISFSQGASFADVNADGYPDLFIGNYFKEYQGKLHIMNDGIIVGSNQMSKAYLLINHKGKSFKDEYEDFGFTHKGFGFGGAFSDFDNDGDLDLIVNHDFGYKSQPNLLMSNQYPDERFLDVSKALDMNRKMNAMGVAVGDCNNDGFMDYYLTNIRANHFMVNQGNGKPFVNRAKDVGTAVNLIFDEKGRYMSVSWGANFADFDNDTDLDLFVANGCLNPNVAPIPDFYFENTMGKFVERAKGAGLYDYGIGRGSAVLDYDNDGDLDLLVVNQRAVDTGVEFASSTKLYRNDCATGNWTKISLRGTQSDTKGIGCRIEVVIDTLKMIREVDGGSGYLSQSSAITHFGLGSATLIDSVIVKWIGGEKQILIDQPINSWIEITQAPREFDSSLLVVLGVLAFFIVSIVIVRRYVKRPLLMRY